LLCFVPNLWLLVALGVNLHEEELKRLEGDLLAQRVAALQKELRYYLLVHLPRPPLLPRHLQNRGRCVDFVRKLHVPVALLHQELPQVLYVALVLKLQQRVLQVHHEVLHLEGKRLQFL